MVVRFIAIITVIIKGVYVCKYLYIFMEIPSFKIYLCYCAFVHTGTFVYKNVYSLTDESEKELRTCLSRKQLSQLEENNVYCYRLVIKNIYKYGFAFSIGWKRKSSSLRQITKTNVFR